MKSAIAIMMVALFGSAEAMAQESSRLSVDVSAKQTIAAGKWLKSAVGSVDIPFGVTFAEPPVVVVSPNYGAPVGCIDTITRVDRDKFQVTSCNAAPNYYTSWIAIGKK